MLRVMYIHAYIRETTSELYTDEVHSKMEPVRLARGSGVAEA